MKAKITVHDSGDVTLERDSPEGRTKTTYFIRAPKNLTGCVNVRGSSNFREICKGLHNYGEKLRSTTENLPKIIRRELRRSQVQS